MAKNEIVWVEWSVKNLDRSKTFYESIFGWKFEAFADGYATFKTPGSLGGGMQRTDEVKPGCSPTVYVEVDSIESYVAAIQKKGGSVAVPKTQIPNVGWFSLVCDPDGNVVGLVQH